MHQSMFTPTLHMGHTDLKPHAWLVHRVLGDTDPKPQADPLPTLRRQRRCWENTQHAAGTYFPHAGSRRHARRMASTGPAGQEQAGPWGGGLGAVQVSHQPAAEEGRRALELHPFHLEVHT